jgi:hypothetical protein
VKFGQNLPTGTAWCHWFFRASSDRDASELTISRDYCSKNGRPYCKSKRNIFSIARCEDFAWFGRNRGSDR